MNEKSTHQSYALATFFMFALIIIASIALALIAYFFA